MCKAHVLRFSCSHGLLMSLEPCPMAPCPMIKTTGVKLPQQPYRCYNCERKRSTTISSESSSSSRSSCATSIGTLDSMSSVSSISSGPTTTAASPPRKSCAMMCALPGVARQPASTVQYCRRSTSTLEKPYIFSCTSSNHYPVPHYSTLPCYLPHQNHCCPPCQLEGMRIEADKEAYALAKKQFPHLTSDMLMRNGRSQEPLEYKMTLERYIDEKRIEEKQTWLFITRKWTQDLKKAGVLVAEEDGLGLLTV